jgi:hypothetical protein
MFIIRLPNGNLRGPESAIADGGRLLGDGYVEIGPDDAAYQRLAAQAVTEEEARQRRLRWQEEDEALHREFLAYRAQRENSWPESGSPDGRDSG